MNQRSLLADLESIERRLIDLLTDVEDLRARVAASAQDVRPDPLRASKVHRLGDEPDQD
jgi:hypothetical protein